jgi:2-keto-3-deoxy-L-rhamnonate aldolase RhmA
MVENRFRKAISRGGCSIGINPGFVSPELVEFFGLVKFDWIFIDGEHMGVGPETCRDLVRAAHGVGVGALVRVPSAEPSVMLGYLETGAFSLLVPHINTAAEAKAAVRAGRYPPHGTRGAGSGSRSANFGLTQTPAEYFATASRETLIIPQVEDMEAVERLEEILGVPELEALFVGPGDLSASMGFAGQAQHPEVQAVVDRVIARAKAASKLVGTTAGSPAAVRRCAGMGVDFVFCSVLPMLANVTQRFLQESRETQRG